MGFWDVAARLYRHSVGRLDRGGARKGNLPSVMDFGRRGCFLSHDIHCGRAFTRFPEEGAVRVDENGLGDFHGFVGRMDIRGFTGFLFDWICCGQRGHVAYVGGGERMDGENRRILAIGDRCHACGAVWLNINGLQIGKWLHERGRSGHVSPLMMSVACAAVVVAQRVGDAFTWAAMVPHWNWST